MNIMRTPNLFFCEYSRYRTTYEALNKLSYFSILIIIQKKINISNMKLEVQNNIYF